MNYENKFIINNESLNIGYIELNKDQLIVKDEDNKYMFYICVSYDWEKISSLNIGEEKVIEYNEYILSKNNESALVWPSKVITKMIDENIICFKLKFEDLTNEKNMCYMNESGCFDIIIENMEVEVYINNKDVVNNRIVYEF